MSSPLLLFFSDACFFCVSFGILQNSTNESCPIRETEPYFAIRQIRQFLDQFIRVRKPANHNLIMCCHRRVKITSPMHHFPVDFFYPITRYAESPRLPLN